MLRVLRLLHHLLGCNPFVRVRDPNLVTSDLGTLPDSLVLNGPEKSLLPILPLEETQEVETARCDVPVGGRLSRFSKA